MAPIKLLWQSKLVLLLVLPFVAADIVLESRWWLDQVPPVAIWTLGLSVVLGLVAWQSGSAKPGAAVAGAAINASLMFATATLPYQPWQTALVPVMTMLVLTSLATRAGRARKERMGIAEHRTGRAVSQVAANLGMAAIASNALTQDVLSSTHWYPRAALVPALLLTGGVAALAEAAADTVSSELGQLMSARPRMLTTLRPADPGTDGAISLGGTLLGMLAAAVVSATAAFALRGGWLLFAFSWIGGVFGLFFDSLLGATLERRGWLNNDGVNFLSTVSAAVVALALLALLPAPNLP